ncbi:MAG: putative zinc-binding protein [Deltaproteobacteria bacterium]|nr:putative zinc-binding protein [Deltaproteobacteria bacterium]
MAEECCTPNGDVMILACSGGSNVGQLANQAAVELTQEGFGKIFCLAGIGGHLSGFVQSARDVPQMVAIDGHAEIPLKGYLVLTELGIEKNKDFKLGREEIEKVKAAAKEAAGEGAASAKPSEKTPSGCSCTC